MKNNPTMSVPSCVETVLLHRSKPVFSGLRQILRLCSHHAILDSFCADTKTIPNRVPKCDVIENEICEIMGFVKLF